MSVYFSERLPIDNTELIHRVKIGTLTLLQI